jgi:diguanylate cyclase (GGDEF)-like protein/putative nucleotidyltransferase with HDIG domain
MPKGNWKSLAFLGAVVVLAGIIFLHALSTLVNLPLRGWSGLLPLSALLVLTVAASRLTISVMNADGVRQTTKSIADVFVFLAAMMYAPATIAPAVILAAVVGLFSSWREADRRLTIFTTAASVVSTFVAATLYGLLINLIQNQSSQQGATLGTLLLPVCAMALTQYMLCTIGVAAFAAFDSGKALTLSKESLVWTSITQVAVAAGAGLFYAAFETGSLIHLFLGALIIGLVYLLYRFDERRVEEVRRAEADKMRHVQEMADLHMNTIESLAIAIDAKDQTTHGHVRRTQIYAKEMGRLLNVSHAESQALLAGALLHDIGKLAVPEYILNKPGKLTESEFAKMKIHPIVGAEILKRVNFPYPVEDIVRYHHEKWDGTGYPQGLKGENIPLVARIISVVDFYDATRCDRPYRVGMKREDSLALLNKMAGTAFDPRIVEMFTKNVEEFDRLIASQDIQEQVQPDRKNEYQNSAQPARGFASETMGKKESHSGFSSITQAQREVFALHEIAQTIGSSLNLNDTVTLVSSKLRAIVPFDICLIYIVDEKSGKAVAVHVAGEHAETLLRRRINIGDGITGWVIANARTMCNTSPELDMVGVPEEIAKSVMGVLVSPLINESGAFGAITLYSKSMASYSTEHVRLLESVSVHASSALNNAITFEKTRESALTDPLTDLPNARAFYMSLEQRVAECQRLNREPVSILSMDLDDFKKVNDLYGHAVGDRMLASVSEVIRKQLRQMDMLARYAGDEFVAIMPMASGETAVMVAERIRSAVESHEFPVRTGRTARVGLSIGIACFPKDGETAEELLTSADRNMQRDKHSRKLGPAIAASSNIASIDMLT